jgi:hypothetical protein
MMRARRLVGDALLAIWIAFVAASWTAFVYLHPIGALRVAHYVRMITG